MPYLIGASAASNSGIWYRPGHLTAPIAASGWETTARSTQDRKG